MPTIYGDGAVYGDTDETYGRIGAALLAAQASTSVRETGLVVQVLDEPVNQWEYFAGEDQYPTAYSTSFGGLEMSKTQQYWSYRGQCDMCILDNGNIVRVRVNVNSQVIESQTITDPTVAAQWESWSTLYSGVHYGVAVAPNGNSPVVYSIKSGGLYRNNSLVWAESDLVTIKLHRAADGRQDLDVVYVSKVLEGMDHPDYPTLTVRKFDMYFSANVNSTDPEEVPWNLAWYRHTAGSFERDDGKVIRIVSFPMYAPLAINSGESLFADVFDAVADIGTEQKPFRLIRGLPGWGHNTLSGANVFKLEDGYFYLFYVEVHTDDDFEGVSNLQTPLVWQRSKDGLNWSEPVHMGFNTWGFAGLVETDDYVYLAGNGRVYRRPKAVVVHDITDYVPQIEWDSPRENQTGTGNFTVANPDGINDYLLDLADRRVIIRPGMKTVDGQYEYAALDDFWMTRFTANEDGNINRIRGEFSNVWGRLENPIRDVLNFIGRTDYSDFLPGLTNEPFNYYFDSGEGEMQEDPEHAHQMDVTGGTVLWTGWKGLNPHFSINFAAPSADCSLYFRYIDEENHMKIVYDGSDAVLYSVKAGVETQLDTQSVGATTGIRLGVRVRFKYIDIYIDNTYRNTVFDEFPNLLIPGYVGFAKAGAFTVNGFQFTDFEYNLTSDDLIRQALAMGDYHDVIIGSAKAKQYALIWGPQTDVPTAADGLRNVLEAEKLELIWRGGFIEVGKFTDTTPVKVLQDEIISTEYTKAGNRRINLANIDGNEHTWFEVDVEDAIERGRMINAYHDLPELMEQDDVRDRAIEEIRRGKLGDSPGGMIPLLFDLWRMDVVTWIDNAGNSRNVRIEGIRVAINQSTEPSQRETLDTSLVEDV